MGFSVLLLQCDHQAEVMARASLSYTLKACPYFVCKHFCAPQCVLWRLEEGVGSPELELEVVVNCLTWLLLQITYLPREESLTHLGVSGGTGSLLELVRLHSRSLLTYNSDSCIPFISVILSLPQGLAQVRI